MNSANEYSYLLGWLLLHPEKKEFLSPAIPQPLLSASSCMCGIRPEHDDYFEDDRNAFMREHVCNDLGGFIFLRSWESACMMNDLWLAAAYRPIALAMRPEKAKQYITMYKINLDASNAQNSKYRWRPIQPQNFTENERALGFEVLHADPWGSCSYLCNSLDKDLFEKCNGTLTQDGLIKDAAIAEQFADYLNEHKLGEPGPKMVFAFFERV